MFRLWLILLTISMLPKAYCQNTPIPVQQQLNKLMTLCNSIKSENQALKVQLRSRDSIAYSNTRNNIFEAFTIITQLSNDYTVTSDKIAVTGLFTKLMQANNPTSDILGFRFSETIIKASEKHFKSELKSEPEKVRFSQVVDKIVNNPVISTLVNSNPITAVTSALVSMVAGFSTTSVDVVKDGNKLKDVSSTTTDAFSQKSIVAFRAELQPYINFYDALNMSSDRYISGIDNLNRRYTFLIGQVDVHKNQLYATIGCNEKSTFYQLSKMLPDPTTQRIDYKTFLNDNAIRQCESFAQKVPALFQTVQAYKREYDMLLKNLLNDYIKSLQSAKTLTPESIDKSKIDTLVKDIEEFMKKNN